MQIYIVQLDRPEIFRLRSLALIPNILAFPLGSDDLADPLDVAYLLFLQLQETVEDSKVELAVETVHLHLDLLFEDHILEGVFPLPRAEFFEHRARVRHVLEHVLLHLHVLDHVGKLILSLALEQCSLLVWLEESDAWDLILFVRDIFHEHAVLNELHGHAVCLEAQNVVHLLACLSPDVVAEGQEVLDPQLLQQQTHDLRILLVHLLKNLVNI